MTILQALFLGLFQGIAEFLPISSSGHLMLLRRFFGLSGVPALFDIILHLATLLSIFVVFRQRIYGIIVSFARWLQKKKEEKDEENLALIMPILVASAITAILGFSLRNLDFSGSPKFIAAFMIFTGLALVFSSIIKQGVCGYKEMGLKRAAIIGLAQGIAVLPGISRSGITISASMASGLKRETAGEFSFLLAIPAILGAFLLEAGDMRELLGSVQLQSLAIGFFTAFISGIIALKLLMPLVRKGKLAWFAVYLLALGLLGLLFL